MNKIIEIEINCDNYYCNFECNYLRKHKSYFCILFEKDLASVWLEPDTPDIERCKDCLKDML